MKFPERWLHILAIIVNGVSALITVHHHKAFLRQGEWSCANLEVERLLTRTTKMWIQETGGPSPWDGDPDRKVAKEIAGRLGGRLLLSIPARGSTSHRAYFKQRQLELDLHPEPLAGRPERLPRSGPVHDRG